MIKLKWILPLLVLAITLGGCPYESTVPIDKPTAMPIDSKLLGQWNTKDADDEYTYTATKFDANTYNFEKKSNKSGDVTNYRGFLSDVGGDRFLNLYEPDGTEKKYYLYKVKADDDGNTVLLLPVTENITETFSTSTELMAFVAKYKNLSFFFGKDVEAYVRAK